SRLRRIVVSLQVGPAIVSRLAGRGRDRQERDAMRARIIELKRNRRVAVGDNLTFLFENRETVLGPPLNRRTARARAGRYNRTTWSPARSCSSSAWAGGFPSTSRNPSSPSRTTSCSP